MQRPSTSKPRGLCKYFKDPRGCYAGDKCKFLHADALPGPSDPPLLTPYDKSKRCKFYDQGYCKRGATCWFLHIDDNKSVDSDEDEPLCSICFEKPSTYGLLIQCSHIFCVECIKQWRDPTGKPPDTISSGSIKSCPMCRTLSTSIVPSSRFYPHTSEERARIVQKYRESTARVDCRYFEKSLAKFPDSPRCPFGSECMYRHRKPDGTTVKLQDKAVVAMRKYHASMGNTRNLASDFFWTELFPEATNDVTEAIRQHIERLRRQAAAEADSDLVEALDEIVPGMEEVTRRTQVAMRTMELISGALVSAGRQSLDMQSVAQQFQRIRDEFFREEESRDTGTNLDEQLDERRRTSRSTRAVRYIQDLGGLADNMLVSINEVLDDDESDPNGSTTLDTDTSNIPAYNPPDDVPALIRVTPAAVAQGVPPTSPNNVPRDPNTAVRSPTILMRHLPPFVQAAAAAVPPAPGEEPPNLTVDLSLALASATTVIQLAEDALRAERRAQDVLVRAREGTQTGGQIRRLLAEARAVLPILRAELETSRMRLQGMETPTPQQRFLVNERIDMLNDVMASMDAQAARQRQRESQPPAGGDEDSDDSMPALRGVSSEEEDSDDEIPELRSVSSSSDEEEDGSDTDDSDGDERRGNGRESVEMLMRALIAVVEGDGGADGVAAMERLDALVGRPRGGTAPTASVNSPRFSTVVDRSAWTPPSPSAWTLTPITSALPSVPPSTATASASTAPRRQASSSSSSHPAVTTTVEREFRRNVSSGTVSAPPAQVPSVASTSSLPTNSVPPSDAKSHVARRTSGDFTTDGRGRVISIGGGGGGCSREGLHWPAEVPDVANDDIDSDSEDDQDASEGAEALHIYPPSVRKVSEFTTDGRGRVISVDSNSNAGSAGNGATMDNATTSTSPPSEPSPSSGTGGLFGWFGSFF